MNYLNIIKITGVMLVFLACNSSKNASDNSNNSNNKELDYSTEWHLKNRIPNCDSAFVFMKHLIVPIETSDARLNNLYLKQRDTKITIPGESNDFYKNEKYNFYVNPDCLIDRESSEVLKIICTNESFKDYLKMDELFQKEKSNWYMTLLATNHFQMTIHFEGGKVTKASVYGGFSKD